MSIFPFIEDVSSTEEAVELPTFLEYAYDFENNCLLLQGGKTYLVEKDEALKIWIYKALKTERFHYLAYSDDFGSEVETLMGKNINPDITFSEIRRFITEALMCNPYIQELSNFRFEVKGSLMVVHYDCTTLYGTMPLSYERQVN